MSDHNQAYAKKCGDCATTADTLYFTKVSFNEGKRRYRMLCAECRAKYDH